MLGAQSIQLGHSNVVVAGGMESMSNIHYIMRSARSGSGYVDLWLTSRANIYEMSHSCSTVRALVRSVCVLLHRRPNQHAVLCSYAG